MFQGHRIASVWVEGHLAVGHRLGTPLTIVLISMGTEGDRWGGQQGICSPRVLGARH